MPPSSTGRASKPGGAEDARGDRRARARLADRDDRQRAAEAVLRRLPRDAVRDVAAARDEALVALVRLADVEQLDPAVSEPALELLDRRPARPARRRRLRASRRRRRSRRRAARRAARSASASSAASMHDGRSGRTNAAFVAKLEPETGTLTAPGRWPAANACAGGRRARSRRPASSDALERRLRAEERAAVQLDDPLHVRRPRRLRSRGRRRGSPRATRRARGCSGARSRSSSTPSSSSPRRRASRRRGRDRPRRRRRARRAACSEWNSPSAPSCASTARSGRAASPTKSESPVSTSHGSSPRERSITANAQCSGRCPGVCIVRIEDVAELDLRPVGERLVRERCAGSRVDPHGHAVLEREPPVPRDVVGVGVRLEHADEPDVVARARVQISLDRVGRDRRRRPRRRARHRRGTTPQPRSSSTNCSNSTRATLATAAAISPEVRIARTALLAGARRPRRPGRGAGPREPRPDESRRTAPSSRGRRPWSGSRSTTRSAPGPGSRRSGTAARRCSRARRTSPAARRSSSRSRRDLPDGDYSVRWAIVSDDGHLESGVLVFGVGAGRAPPAAGSDRRGDRPDASTAPAHAGSSSPACSAPRASRSSRSSSVRATLERIPIVVSTAGVLAALGAAQEIHRVGLSTRDGTVLGVAFVIALVVATLGAAAMLDRRRCVPRSWSRCCSRSFPSFAGHALDQGLSRVNVVADVLHVAIGRRLDRRARRPRRHARRAICDAWACSPSLRCRAARRHRHHAGGLRADRPVAALGHVVRPRAAREDRPALGALVLGRLLRRRVRRARGIELVLVAAIVVAVSVLVELRPGRNVVSPLQGAALASQPSAPPPPPPRGAIVVAQESGPLGVAIEAEPQRITAIVLSPAGGGLSGLDVSIDGQIAEACGSGCYSVERRAGPFGGRADRQASGRRRRVRFALPAKAPDAATLVRNAGVVFRTLQHRHLSRAARLRRDARARRALAASASGRRRSTRSPAARRGSCSATVAGIARRRPEHGSSRSRRCSTSPRRNGRSSRTRT